MSIEISGAASSCVSLDLYTLSPQSENPCHSTSKPIRFSDSAFSLSDDLIQHIFDSDGLQLAEEKSMLEIEIGSGKSDGMGKIIPSVFVFYENNKPVHATWKYSLFLNLSERQILKDMNQSFIDVISKDYDRDYALIMGNEDLCDSDKEFILSKMEESFLFHSIHLFNFAGPWNYDDSGKAFNLSPEKLKDMKNVFGNAFVAAYRDSHDREASIHSAIEAMNKISGLSMAYGEGYRSTADAMQKYQEKLAEMEEAKAEAKTVPKEEEAKTESLLSLQEESTDSDAIEDLRQTFAQVYHPQTLKSACDAYLVMAVLKKTG